VSYLVDTSALVRIFRNEVDESWQEAVDRGLVAICDPVLTEALALADAKQFERVERHLLERYPWVPVPDDAWEIVATVRRKLAVRSMHQALSVADYLVVATGIRRNLTILHLDGDFETAAECVPIVRQERIGLVD